MGYTHYWYRPTELDAQTFAQFAKDVDALRTALEGKVVICGPLGDGSPIIEPDQISLNGTNSKDRSHETFAIDRVYKPYSSHDKPHSDGSWFEFCKTARKPYDTLVTASLLMFRYRFGEQVAVESDGFAEEWTNGYALVAQVLGPGIARSALELVGLTRRPVEQG